MNMVEGVYAHIGDNQLVKAPAATYERIAQPFLDGLLEIEKSGVRPGIPTGLSKVDGFLGGLQPGGLYIVGARPAMG
jgi:replicative DNA helicase